MASTKTAPGSARAGARRATTRSRITGTCTGPAIDQLQRPAIAVASPIARPVMTPAPMARTARRVVDTETLRVDSIPRRVRSWMSRIVATVVLSLCVALVAACFGVVLRAFRRVRCPPALDPEAVYVAPGKWCHGPSTREEASRDGDGQRIPGTTSSLIEENASSWPARYSCQAWASQISHVVPLPTTTTSRSSPA